jgi:OOP family OmpA-OmpF porin
MKKIIILCAFGCMALTSSVNAGGKFVSPAIAAVEPIPVQQSPVPIYLGIGLAAAGVSRDCPCAADDRLKDMTYGVVFRAGWDFNQYFGIEARYIRASLEKDFSTTTHYGLYLKPQYPVTNQMNVYGLLGYGHTEIEGCSYSNGTLKVDGISYGAGIEYDLTSDDDLGEYDRAFDGQGDQEKGWGIWADFQHMLDAEGVWKTNSNVGSAGVSYDF